MGAKQEPKIRRKANPEVESLLRALVQRCGYLVAQSNIPYACGEIMPVIVRLFQYEKVPCSVIGAADALDNHAQDEVSKDLGYRPVRPRRRFLYRVIPLPSTETQEMERSVNLWKAALREVRRKS